MNKLLSIKEASELLNVTTSTLRRKIDSLRKNKRKSKKIQALYLAIDLGIKTFSNGTFIKSPKPLKKKELADNFQKKFIIAKKETKLLNQIITKNIH